MRAVAAVVAAAMRRLSQHAFAHFLVSLSPVARTLTRFAVVVSHLNLSWIDSTRYAHFLLLDDGGGGCFGLFCEAMILTICVWRFPWPNLSGSPSRLNLYGSPSRGIGSSSFGLSDIFTSPALAVYFLMAVGGSLEPF